MTESRDEVFDRILASEGAALRRVASLYEANAARREDLLQEICLAIWTALPRFRGESSLRTFVFRIAHNQGIRHSSRNAEWRKQDLESAAEIADSADGPERRIQQAQEAERLQEAMRRLPVLQREALALLLEGLRHSEIAEILGTTENSIGIRLTRARKALREELDQLEVRRK